MINFSIIIPHKNSADLLVNCLASIPVKDDIQVIVVDDNSDADKVNFYHFPKWDGKNYEYYFTKEGRGAGYARNVGVEHAKGKYIVFADADDWFEPGMYETLSAISQSESEIHFYKMDSVRVKTGEQSTRHLNRNASIDAFLQGNVSSKEAAVWQTAVAGQIYSCKLIKDNNIRFDETVVSNDAMFATKAGCLAKSIEFHNEILYVVGDYGKGLHDSKQKDASRFIQMHQVDLHVQRFCAENGIRKTKTCMLKMLTESYRRFGKNGFKMAVKMVVKEHALFYGLGEYLMRKLHK